MLFDLFGDEAGNCFFASTLSEDPLSIENNSKSLEKLEQFVGPQEVCGIPWPFQAQRFFSKEVGFENYPSSFL